ncbi:putative reverse transcriptase domain-containing protein [Tanacetum coccineum]
MNIDQDRQMLMVDDNVGNQFRENAMHNNGLSVVPGIENQHGNGNVVATRAEGNSNEINGNQIRCYNCRGILLNYEEFDFMAAAGAYDEIEKVTANCTLQDNLQHASTSGTQSDKASVHDSDGSAEADESIAKQKALELEIERLLKEVVSQDIMSIVQNPSETNYAKFGYDWYKKDVKIQIMTNFVDKAYNDMQQKIEWLQAQLGDQKGKSKDTPILSEHEKWIAPGIFRINPFISSGVDNFVPNKHVKASVRTKPITVSQPHVITKNDVNSKTNGFSPKDVKSTTRTRRPQPRNNPKSDKVPFKSKSSCLSNKLEKIEENHRSLQSSNYSDHTSSECNNIKLAIRNEKSEVICATCKQCLITANHDECVLQYVNGMKSTKKNQSANVSNVENQKKHKPKVRKPKKNYSNGENQVVSKSSVVTTADASDKRQQRQNSTSSISTLTTAITVDGNFDLETIKNQFTHSKNPKVDKKGLGYGFATKACFVCGSLSHLIRDCEFHEKRMAKQVELNKQKGKGSSQREIRPVWNNVQSVNHKNQFVPTTVLTRTGKIPVSTARNSGTNTVNTARASGTNNVSTARHNFNSQAVLTNTARKISTVKPFVDRVRPKTIFHKTHSPFRRPFNNTTALKTNFSKQKVNTGAENKGIVDSGCSSYMTGNNAYLAEYQDFNGGPVAFGGSKGYITSKEFKNRDVIEFCGSKGIKREYSNARTPQQNGVAERKNRTLIEAARTMLADLIFT